MKKIKGLCGIIFVAILCVSMFLIFRNDEKKQVDLKVNANQNENSNRNLHNEDETEVNNQEVEINDIDSEEKNFLKDKIADDKSEAEANAIVDPKPIISSNESIKTEVSVDIDDFGEDGNVQDEEVEFRDDFVDWEDMTDSDSDGLPDDYEKDIGTDSNNADTDGDGLTDGFEELWSATNPLKCDSFDDEISDSELDLDNDGLGMLEEYRYYTDPLEADSDNDGLNDGTEVHINGTDPLVDDTDGDGLSDGDEVIVGLDPLKTATFGNPDMEYCYQVDIGQDEELLKKINDNNEEYKMSLQINAKGQVLSNIYIRESAYTESLREDHILGVIPEIICSDEQVISDMIIYFEINEKLLDEDDSIASLKGVSKYNVFKFDEDENTLYPINTIVDEDANTIFADIYELGTYCIVDMEKWLSDLGFYVADYDATNETIMSVEAISNENNEPEKIDLVIILNHVHYEISEQELNCIKGNLFLICKAMFEQGTDVRIFIIDQSGNILAESTEKDYADDVYQAKRIIDKLTNECDIYRNLEEQVEVLLNISMREDAQKNAIFIGPSQLVQFESWLVKAEAENIYCSVVCPGAGYGSLYGVMVSRTGGILLNNYLAFSNEYLEHIYGYVPCVTYIPYTTVSSAGLRIITLDEEITKDSKTDTDKDGLSDWEEIKQSKVTVNEDGSIIFPTYWEYLQNNFLQRVAYVGWYIRYESLHNVDGKTLEEMLSEVYVLPIVSDPSKKDSDGDGISDYDEVKWDGIDERYQELSPLHKDTVETLFPEIESTGYNDRAYATYISVDDNDVVLHVKAYFTGDAETEVSQYLKTTGLSQECQDEVDNIKSRLGEDFTFKELIIDGVQSRWSGVYRGSSYDFCPGLKVNFTIDFVEDDNPEWGERSIEVNVKNGVCGYSNCVNRFGWKTNSIRIIQIYTSYCDNSYHENRFFNECNDYVKNQYNIVQYEGVVAHEFGHAFGLMDMYDDAYCNKGYEPLSNDELEYDKRYCFVPTGKGIMMISGKAVTNDIEMILLAFCENKKQYYVPQGTSQKVSKAIKKEARYFNKSNPEKVYRWNQVTHSFQIE